MCGIGGIVQFDGDPGLERALTAMSESEKHRGPDGEGTLVRGHRVGFFHRRLSILDVAGGAQPMSNEDGTVWVTFNGEIYNFADLKRELEAAGHRFRTSSDTEVIVHAYEEWGDRSVERFRGMFAFAVLDEPRGTVFLARDRVGIKPLVYWQSDSCFAFASELQALRAHPRFDPSMSLEALDAYLQFQYIPAPLTIYRAARKLAPGCTLTVRLDGRVSEPRRYWNLTFAPDETVSEDEWCRRLDHELRESVRCHTISDVPFGAFLSGGVDSSVVVVYMTEVLESPVQTFSIGFDEQEYDETAYARQVAQQFQTIHHEERVKPAHLDVLPALVKHYGEPFGDSSAVPTYYLSRMTSSHVKMALSGDGGDEAFAGYRTYADTLRGQLGPREPARRARFAAGAVLRKLKLRPPLWSPRDSWYSRVSIFDEQERLSLWRPQDRRNVQPTREWYDRQFDLARHEDFCSHLQRLDIDTYLPNDILTKVDIASMLNGLEVRVPLLDHRVLELVATIPSRFKWRQGSYQRPDTGKYLLKKTAQRFFSESFLNREKKGFEIPIRRWFGDSGKQWIRERLLRRGSPLDEWMDRGVVERLLADHETGAAAHHPRLWSLLVLDEWLAQDRGKRLQSTPSLEPVGTAR